MLGVLQSMNMTPPADASGNTYALTFNNETIMYFIDSPDGALDVVADAGTLHNRQANEVLLSLLALNRPPFSVNLEKSTSKITVWVRQKTVGLKVSDITGLIPLLLGRVAEVKATLADNRQSTLKESGSINITHAKLINSLPQR